MSNIAKYSEIFDYLSAPEMPTQPESIVVFGRNDSLVARAAGDLVVSDLAETIVISGGVGKDSGDLLKNGYRSEAHFLDEELQRNAQLREYVLPKVLLDEVASSGHENARNSLRILTNYAANIGTITAVAHATSLRRLAETLRFEAGKTSGQHTVHKMPTAYEFDPTNPTDQHEAALELLRLADWPSKGWLGQQTNVPENLVDFARSIYGNAPKLVPLWQTAILRRFPKDLQLRIMQFAANRGRK